MTLPNRDHVRRWIVRPDPKREGTVIRRSSTVNWRWRWPTLGVAVTAALATAVVFSSGATARTQRATAAKVKPTIVLVHGAWANSASWDGVIDRLHADGYTVYAPPNPLRSLMGDARSIAGFLQTIKGPVVLVGHSYGGAVITNAAEEVSNVKALVYDDAFIPAKGESVGELDAKYPGSVLLSAPQSKVFRAVPTPGEPKTDPTLYVNQPYFMKGFANDLTARQAEEAYATQGPVTAGALAGKSGTPAWQHIPSWAILGTQDRAIPPKTLMFMDRRAHAHITKVKAGHLSMVSQPGVVAKVIVEAADSIS
jgi:pimeloyl-ACP methyl ester carboxylesterase